MAVGAKTAMAHAAPRLRATGLAVFGLLSFWIYTAWRVAGAVDALAAARAGAGADLPGTQRWMPRAALGAFAVCAALVSAWWSAAMVYGVEPHAPWLLLTVAVASIAFWAGLAILMLWLLQALEAFEAAASFASRGPFDADSAEAFALRWEQATSRVALFLIVAVPCVASPTLATWAWGSGRVGLELAYAMLAAVFLAALVVHAWGTALLLQLWNAHVAFERSPAVAARPGGAVGSDAAAGEAPPRQLAAIMLTDMVGYSRGMELDEAGAYRKLQTHNEVVRRFLVAHRGREIKTIGDAFLVLFVSAQDSVDCALSVQRAFAEYNTTREGDDRILIRIGLHLGDVIVTKDDVFGDGVNVAARIEPLAEPGGICISDAVYMSVRKRLSVEVDRVDDSGVKLKNISMRPDLYRLRLG